MDEQDDEVEATADEVPPPAPIGPLMVGGHEVKLTPPSSFAACYTIFAAATNNKILAFTAALGLCWTGKGRPKVRFESCQWNAVLYGARVLDELHARGVRTDEIMAAGARAWMLCSQAAISEQEVATAAGFSGAPGSSTS